MMEHEPRWRMVNRKAPDKAPDKDSILVSPYAYPYQFRVRNTWNDKCLVEFEYIDGSERGVNVRGAYGVHMTIGKFSGRILAMSYPESCRDIFLSVTRKVLHEFSTSHASHRGSAHDFADYNLPFIETFLRVNYKMILKDFNKVSQEPPTIWEWATNFVKKIFS